MSKKTICFILSISLFTLPAFATNKPQVEKKQTNLGLYLTATEAYKLKHQGGNKILFIDIRTPSELVFVGSPTSVDINIPFMRMNYQHWDKQKNNFQKKSNRNFVTQVNNAVTSRALTKDSTILLICRSGSRSAKAANALSKNGYTNVYTVVDGFEGDKSTSQNDKGKRVVNGWKNSGLPWSYKLDSTKLRYTVK